MSMVSHSSHSTRWGKSGKDRPFVLVEITGGFEYRPRRPESKLKPVSAGDMHELELRKSRRRLSRGI